MARIRDPKDFWAGLLFVAFGVAAIVLGSQLQRWAPRRAWVQAIFRASSAFC